MTSGDADGPDPRLYASRAELIAASRSARPGNYNPGHNVHWMQVKIAGRELSQAETGQIEFIDRTGLHINVGRDVRRYGVRDKVAVADLTEQHGPDVRIQERWQLVWIGCHPISVRGPL